jgi:hypothetical protein
MTSDTNPPGRLGTGKQNGADWTRFTYRWKSFLRISDWNSLNTSPSGWLQHGKGIAAQFVPKLALGTRQVLERQLLLTIFPVYRAQAGRAGFRGDRERVIASSEHT